MAIRTDEQRQCVAVDRVTALAAGVVNACVRIHGGNVAAGDLRPRAVLMMGRDRELQQVHCLTPVNHILDRRLAFAHDLGRNATGNFSLVLLRDPVGPAAYGRRAAAPACHQVGDDRELAGEAVHGGRMLDDQDRENPLPLQIEL